MQHFLTHVPLKAMATTFDNRGTGESDPLPTYLQHCGGSLQTNAGVGPSGRGVILKYIYFRTESFVSDIPFQNGKECHSQHFPSWSHRTGYLWGHPGCPRAAGGCARPWCNVEIRVREDGKFCE